MATAIITMVDATVAVVTVYVLLQYSQEWSILYGPSNDYACMYDSSV